MDIIRQARTNVWDVDCHARRVGVNDTMAVIDRAQVKWPRTLLRFSPQPIWAVNMWQVSHILFLHLSSQWSVISFPCKDIVQVSRCSDVSNQVRWHWMTESESCSQVLMITLTWCQVAVDKCQRLSESSDLGYTIGSVNVYVWGVGDAGRVTCGRLP